MTYKTFKSFILEFIPGDEKVVDAIQRAKDAAEKTNHIATMNKNRADAMVQASKDRLARNRARELARKQKHDDQQRASLAHSKR